MNMFSANEKTPLPIDVLIAEDDLTSRVLLENVLRKWGYNVTSTANGEEAWEVLTQRENAPRLLILDWMMPGMDGIELCRRIRQEYPGKAAHIILLTSLSEKQDVVMGLEAGANDYIVKPFDNAELMARVNAGRRFVELQTALEQRLRQLEEALSHIRTLQGIIPICMYCHKVRKDAASWQHIEHYIQEHSGVFFSHGICPECMRQRYPESVTEEEPPSKENSFPASDS